MPAEKSVFISYRRSNIYTARAVYQLLVAQNYDVFLDYSSIDNGSFERIILNQIAARAHFLLILTPGTLRRCVDPTDWVRREIEHAIATKRNIVPLMFDDFDFRDQANYLDGELLRLPGYNGLRIYAEYFDEGIERLVSRFLSKPITATLHPLIDPPATQAQPSLEAVDILTKRIEAEKLLENSQKQAAIGQARAAFASLAKALLLAPDFVEGYHDRALLFKQHGKFVEALADFDAVLTHDPRHEAAYYERGETKQMLEDYQGAVEDYSRALQLNPANADARCSRGNARMKRGDFEQAAEDYAEVLRLAPTYLNAKLLLDEARRLAGSSPVSMLVRKFKNQQALHQPETPRDYFYAALVRAKSDRRGQLEDLDKALELDPKYMRAHVVRASVLYDMGAFDAAVAAAERAYELRPDRTYLLANLAEFRLAQGDYEGAISNFMTVLDQAPENVHAQSGLALALYKIGKVAQAQSLWRKLFTKDSRHRHAASVGDYLNWHPSLTAIAHELITTKRQ